MLTVSHDLTLNSAICSAPPGPSVIRELTLEQVRKWDCGSRKNAHFPKQRSVPGAQVPTLDEVLALAGRGSFGFNIEPKIFRGRPRRTPPRGEYARVPLGAIRRHGLEFRAIAQSSDLGIPIEIKRLESKIRLAAICTRRPTEYVAKAFEAEAPIVAPNYTLETLEGVQAAHKAGLEVLCWRPNEPSEWDRLVRAGADAIGTDAPAALIEYLKMRGVRRLL